MSLNTDLRQALYDAADNIGGALLEERPVDLEVIRSLQAVIHLARLIDLRLQANALPVVMAAEKPCIEGEIL
jgi:hypothetical protein